MSGVKEVRGKYLDKVARNVKVRREHWNLTYAEMSRRLTEVGTPIPVLGLRRIERHLRNVSVDELIGLAKVLKTDYHDLLVKDLGDEG